jgi:hypothetical protein
MSGPGNGRRVTMREAADELGLTVEAIRKRIQRGSLRSDKGQDGRRYVYLGEYHREVQGESSELVGELRDRLRYVEGQLAAEREAHAEARRLLLAALERIPPQLEAPQEPPGSPETATEDQERAEPRPPTRPTSSAQRTLGRLRRWLSS